MSGYGIFESAATDGYEQEQRTLEASQSLDGAIFAAREQFGSFLGEATTRSDFDTRLALVKKDLFKVVEANGVMPVTGVMNKVTKALRPNFKAKQAAADAARTSSRRKRAAEDEQKVLVPKDDWEGYLDEVAPQAKPAAEKNMARRKRASGEEQLSGGYTYTPRYTGDTMGTGPWAADIYGPDGEYFDVVYGTDQDHVRREAEELVEFEGESEGYYSASREAIRDDTEWETYDPNDPADAGWAEMDEWLTRMETDPAQVGEQREWEKQQLDTYNQNAYDEFSDVPEYGSRPWEASRKTAGENWYDRDFVEWSAMAENELDALSEDEVLELERAWMQDRDDSPPVGSMTLDDLVDHHGSRKTADHWKFDQAFQQFLLDVYGTTHGLTDDEIIEAMENYAGIGTSPEVIGDPVDAVPPTAAPGQPVASRRKQAGYQETNWRDYPQGQMNPYGGADVYADYEDAMYPNENPRAQITGEEDYGEFEYYLEVTDGSGQVVLEDTFYDLAEAKSKADKQLQKLYKGEGKLDPDQGKFFTTPGKGKLF